MNIRLNAAIFSFIIFSIFILLIESIFNISLNVFYYIELIFNETSNAIIPLQPTSGDWIESTNNLKILMKMVTFFLRVLSSPALLIAAIVYMLYSDQ